MKAALFLLLSITGLSAPVARPIPWSDVSRVISTWKAVNPSGTAAWATSESMLPGIRVGDLMLAEEYVGQPLKGEIPVYHFSDQYPDVSHECIAEGRSWFIAKGTNNTKADPKQSKDRVKYVVVAVLRPGY